VTWQKVKQDLILAGSSHLFQKIIGYVVLMILTRHLTKTSMGELFFAATFASFFAIATELGTFNYLVRRVAEDADHALKHLSEVISLRLPFIVLSFGLLNILSLILFPELTLIVFLTSIYVLFEDFYSSFGALLLGLNRVGYRVISGITGPFLLLVFVFITVMLDGNLIAILISYIIANMIMIGFTALLIYNRIGRFGLDWNLAVSQRVLHESFPFFLLIFLGLLFFKIDTIMLGVLQSTLAVAQYEAGYKLFEVSRFLVRPLAMIFLPLCSQMYARKAWSELQAVSQKLLLVVGTVGIGLSIVVALLASFITAALWGTHYQDSAPVLRVLYLAVPALYTRLVGTFLAIALNIEKKVIRIMVGCVTMNVVLNMIFIPMWGPIGASWTTLISEYLLAGFLILIIIKDLRFRSRTIRLQ
jgi:O-antigen/teichoic acid export membrane protein